MEKDFKIFDDKNFSDLSKEIYENSKLKKTQIDLLIQEVHGYIQGIEDIAIVGPVLKELFDVAVKNDDNLLKLATVIQRIMSKQQFDDSDISLLSDAEKEELINSLEDAAVELQKKSDDIDVDKVIDNQQIDDLLFNKLLELNKVGRVKKKTKKQKKQKKSKRKTRKN